MNKSRDGFKSPFGFTVVHAIRKNFAFPLAVFVMSLALYLRSFFGSDKIRQLTALKSGGSATLELLRESGKFLIIGGSDNYMLTDILYFYTAAVVVLSAALGIMLFRFVSSRAKNNVSASAARVCFRRTGWRERSCSKRPCFSRSPFRQC